MEDAKNVVVSWIDKQCEGFYKYADAIWSYAELGCEEVKSSRLLVDLFESHGFEVESGVAGMPTAFVASWGTGNPVIGINCEYDALPGLSQRPASEKDPVVEGAPGHGCGHNILGVGSAMAAIAVKEWLAADDVQGSVKVLGTPAEEMAVGKPFMARAGLFNGFDAIIDWHPGVENEANFSTCNAYFSIKFHFSGRTAHGSDPWEGRSALDAALLMGHALELLREHIPPGNPDGAHTINYTFPNVGSEYPSIVPDRSTIWVIGRITTVEEADRIIERIQKCAKGASLATETTVESAFITATHERIPNKTLSSVLYKNLQNVGCPKFDEAEQVFARKMQRDLGVDEVGLVEDVTEFKGGWSPVADNSEFSWFAPFARFRVATGPAGTGWHNWQVTAASRTTIGRKAMTTAANVLAVSAVDLFTKPHLIDEAKKEFDQRLAGRTYRPIIPSHVEPPTDFNREVMEKYRGLMENHYEKPS